VIVIHFPFQNGEIRFNQRHVRERHRQPVAKLAQLIKRDADLVPRLIERHYVLVRINNLFDVLVVVVPPDHVTLFDFDLVDLFFGLEMIKTGPYTFNTSNMNCCDATLMSSCSTTNGASSMLALLLPSRSALMQSHLVTMNMANRAIYNTTSFWLSLSRLVYIALLAKRPLIFKMFNDVLVFNALIVVHIELVFNVFLVVIDFNDALDFEHTDQ
jgi:hypothetical protein